MTIIRALLILTAFVLLASTAVSCRDKPQNQTTDTVKKPADWSSLYGKPEAGTIKALGCDKSETTVLDIDHPDNPYRGRYLEFDYWCWGHTTPDDAELMAYFSGAGPEGYQVTNLVVDADGFIVPQLEIYRMNILQAHQAPGKEWLRSEYKHLDLANVMLHEDGDTCMRTYRTGGVIDPGITADFEAEVCRILAPYVPAVPQWLAKNPPLLVLLMLDGDIACYGELGSDDGGLLGLASAEAGGEHPWTRYNHAGEELQQLEPGHSWVELFFPDYEVIREEAESRGSRIFVQAGLVAELGSDGEGLNALYDHLGNPLEPERTVTDELPLPYEELPGRLVEFIYIAQQATPEQSQ